MQATSTHQISNPRDSLDLKHCKLKPHMFYECGYDTFSRQNLSTLKSVIAHIMIAEFLNSSGLKYTKCWKKLFSLFFSSAQAFK